MASDNRWLAAATRRLVAGGLGGKQLAQQLTELSGQQRRCLLQQHAFAGQQGAVVVCCAQQQNRRLPVGYQGWQSIIINSQSLAVPSGWQMTR